MVALTFGACARIPAEDAPGEWRQWRGPSAQGVSSEKNLPEVWTADSPNIRWKTEIPGEGSSSPVVTQGRVFLTSAFRKSGETKNIHTRFVMALDLKSGEVLWSTQVLTGPVGKIHHLNTHAAATPATDGSSLFVAFDGHLAALDLEGQLLWDKNVDPDYYKHSHYGLGTSPVVSDTAVILMQDREEGNSDDPGWIAAYDKQTGDEIWRSEWTDTCCSYTTPIVNEFEGTRELLISSSGWIRALDPETGELLWQGDQPTLQPVPSLITAGELIIAPGGVHNRKFLAVKRSGKGGDVQVESLWQQRRQVPEIGTPIFYKDRLFSMTRGGLAVALDLETGKFSWNARLKGKGLRDPSMVAGDDKIYVSTRNGDTDVISVAGEEPELVATNSLGEGSPATPAIADGCLLIRGKKHLFCIEGESGGSASPAAQP